MLFQIYHMLALQFHDSKAANPRSLLTALAAPYSLHAAYFAYPFTLNHGRRFASIARLDLDTSRRCRLLSIEAISRDSAYEAAI